MQHVLLKKTDQYTVQESTVTLIGGALMLSSTNIQHLCYFLPISNICAIFYQYQTPMLSSTNIQHLCYFLPISNTYAIFYQYPVPMLSSTNIQYPGGSDEEQCAVTPGSIHTRCGEVCSQMAPAEARWWCAGRWQGDVHEGCADHQGQETGVRWTGGGQKQTCVSLCGGLVGVCVCVCVCVCVHILLCAFVCVYACVCVSVCVFLDVTTYAFVHAYKHVYVHASKSLYDSYHAVV